MGKIRTIELSGSSRKALEKGLHSGDSSAFRKRCQLVLLKSEGRSSQQVGDILKMTGVSVNSWLDRYEQEGIAGLHTKPGRGRKPLLDQQQDVALVRRTVQAERQRLGQAKLILEQELEKKFSLKTLKRFLKSLTAATKE